MDVEFSLEGAMNYSLIGRCAETGQLGAAVATLSLAAGARIPFAMAGVGAIVTQYKPDPRLGCRGLSLLRSGCTAEETLNALVASTSSECWRQIAVIDMDGSTAHHNGAEVGREPGAAHGQDVLAVCYGAANTNLPTAMVEAFVANAGRPLAERLLRGLEAAQALRCDVPSALSAALLVVEREEFSLVDLRVDRTEDAVSALRILWDEFAPVSDDFLVLAIDPENAPAAF